MLDGSKSLRSWEESDESVLVERVDERRSA